MKVSRSVVGEIEVIGLVSETFPLESEGRTLVRREEKSLFRLMAATYRSERRLVGVLHVCANL